MNRKKIIAYCTIGILVVSAISCEYYLGINQQPRFADKHIEEGMNIFGLLRPDMKGDFNKSFVFVQKLWPVLELEEGYTIIRDVSVRVEHIIDGNVVKSIDFPLLPSDSLFTDTLYRPLEPFIPQSGGKYRLICQYDGLPDAIGEAVFPPQPAIAENSLSVNGRDISFTLTADTLIKMVDIYLIGNNYSKFLERLIPSATLETDITLTLPVDPQGKQLKLFVYDANLAVYYGNSNTSLNFNKYRTTISTLESGFGVFGALNYSVIAL